MPLSERKEVSDRGAVDFHAENLLQIVNGGSHSTDNDSFIMSSSQINAIKSHSPNVENLSPIPKASARFRFAKRIQDFSERGRSPLIQPNREEERGNHVDLPSADESQDCSVSDMTVDEEEVFQKPFLAISKSSSSDTTGGLQVQSFPTDSESGYSSLSRHLQPVPGQNFTEGLSITDDSELKLSQLQGTSTPRSRLNNNATAGSKLVETKTPISEEVGDASSYAAVTNPFDSHLLESLHKHTFSPSVFKNVVSPDKEDNNTPSGSKSDFQWSIDHIAVLNPAQIEEFPEQQALSETLDTETEALIHQAIEHFWSSQQHIAPSPLDQQVNRPRLISLIEKGIINSASKLVKGDSQGLGSGMSSPLVRASKIISKGSKDCVTQTSLTFPPSLDLVKLLGGCFQYNEENEGLLSAESGADVNLSVNSLRRKLFSQTQEDAVEHQQAEYSAISCPMSINNSTRCETPPWLLDEDNSTECDESEHEAVHGGRRSSAGDFSALGSPEISPIKFQ